MELAESFASKTVDQWLLLAVVYSENAIDKTGIRKLLKGHFGFSETSFIKAKNFLISNKLIKAEGSKGKAYYFTPNFERIASDISFGKTLPKPQHRKFKVFLENKKTRKIFFDPNVVSKRKDPFIFALANLMQYAITANTHAQLGDKESEKVREAQNILLRLNPSAVPVVKKLNENFEKHLQTKKESIEYFLKASEIGDILKKTIQNAMK